MSIDHETFADVRRVYVKCSSRQRALKRLSQSEWVHEWAQQGLAEFGKYLQDNRIKFLSSSDEEMQLLGKVEGDIEWCGALLLAFWSVGGEGRDHHLPGRRQSPLDQLPQLYNCVSLLFNKAAADKGEVGAIAKQALEDIKQISDLNERFTALSPTMIESLYEYSNLPAAGYLRLGVLFFDCTCRKLRSEQFRNLTVMDRIATFLLSDTLEKTKKRLKNLMVVLKRQAEAKRRREAEALNNLNLAAAMAGRKRP